MTNYFIRNRETLKLELHFEKAAYIALSDEQKTKIKSNFVWGRHSGCWISRAKEPNLYSAIRCATALGLEDGGEEGERPTFAAQMEAKAERAERRADRLEAAADRADSRADGLQAAYNSSRGDVAFFTQPNISTSAGRAFTKQRQQIFDRFDKGVEEHQHAEELRERAETARETAAQKGMQDKGFLMRRIEERRASIRKIDRETAEGTALLEKAAPDGTIKTLYGATTVDRVNANNAHRAKRRAEIQEELDYYQNALDALGGVAFSRDNIKPGYTVAINNGRFEWVGVVISCGPKNIKFRTKYGVLTHPYAEITRIIKGETA